jgi:hypothetical protein
MLRYFCQLVRLNEALDATWENMIVKVEFGGSLPLGQSKRVRSPRPSMTALWNR